MENQDENTDIESVAQEQFGSLLNAYESQRNFRRNNPAVDAGLSLIPIVGSMTAVDDVANDIQHGQYKQAAVDAAGVIPLSKYVKSGVGLINAGNTALRTALLAKGVPLSIVNSITKSTIGASVAGAAGGANVYGTNVLNDQIEANRRQNEDRYRQQLSHNQQTKQE